MYVVRASEEYLGVDHAGEALDGAARRALGRQRRCQEELQVLTQKKHPSYVSLMALGVQGLEFGFGFRVKSLSYC